VSSGKVFVVDDDASVLRALTRLLRAADFEVQGFQSAEDFLIHHDKTTPGCAVIDVNLGAHNGIDVLLALARDGCMRPTIFISGQSDIAISVRAMKAGAIDFLTKPIYEKVLIAAVRSGIERDRSDREQGAKFSQVAKQLSSLTPEEAKVLTRVIGGRRNKEIAGDLGITEKTVKFYRRQVMEKMAVRTVAGLVRTVNPILTRLLSGKRIPKTDEPDPRDQARG
jgi:FixJ family two-component response regulator